MTSMGHITLLLLAVLILAAGAQAAPAGAGHIVDVYTHVELVSAIANSSVGTVQLRRNMTLQQSSGSWTPFTPLLLRHNLTIRSACAAAECTPQEIMTLDFGFLSGLVTLDVDVLVTFSNLMLASFRMSAGFGLDLFTGRQGSSILVQDVHSHRLVCSPSTFQSQVLQSTAAAYTTPDLRTIRVLDLVCWRGFCYPGTMHYDEYRMQVPPTSSRDSVFSSHGTDTGYEIMIHNSTRLCSSYWDLSCLNTMTADDCNRHYTLLALQPVNEGSHLAALVVPVVVGGVLLVAALVAFIYMLRRRRWRHLQTKQANASMAPAQLGGTADGGSQKRRSFDMMGSVLKFADGPPMAKQGRASWQLLAVHSSPSLEGTAPDQDSIELGVLLGAGSSGRVYKARWHDQTVAVKVLEHDAHTAALVANEIDLMMGFDHKNLVRAYHAISWYEKSATTTEHTQSTAGKEAAKGGQKQSYRPGFGDVLVPMGQGLLHKGSTSPPGTASTGGEQGSGGLHDSTGLQGQAEASAPNTTCLQDSGPRSAAAVASDVHMKSDSLSSAALVRAQTWLILEFCDGGTLGDAVRTGAYRAQAGGPHMAKILTALCDVASGMRYLHARNVLHRDLKAANCMLATDTTARYGITARVADFGLSYMMDAGQTHHSTRTMGTISHMAPELLRAGKQSPAADVYAFGIVMWELLSERSAFGGAHYGEVFERVAIKGERPALDPVLQHAAGEGYILLMAACWNAQPSLRPTFERVCGALDLLLQHHATPPEATLAHANTASVAALTNSLMLHCNVTVKPDAEVEPQPVHGFF